MLMTNEKKESNICEWKPWEGGDVKFPFKTVLSFHKLINYWENKLKTGSEAEKLYAGVLMEKIKRAPDLRKPIYNRQVVADNQEAFQFLMESVFPPALTLN